MSRGRRHVRFRQRVGRQVHRPIRYTVPQLVRPVGEIDQTVFESLVEGIGDRDDFSGFAGHVDHQIDTHGRADHNDIAIWCMRGHGLAIQRDDDWFKISKIQPEYPRVRRVD